MLSFSVHKVTWIATAAVMGITMFGSGLAKAQDIVPPEMTIMTFDAPVEVPGMVLKAGTYVFKVIEPSASQDTIQVLDKDQKHVVTTFLAIPDERLRPTGKTVVMFEERPANSPEAIRAWFVPGEDYGHQLVYPHERAMKLAKQSRGKVLATRDKKANGKSKVYGVDANGQTSDVELPPVHPGKNK